MPNWCNNTVEIRHNDPAVLAALCEAVNQGDFCKTVIPIPESLQIVAGCVGADDNPEQIALVESENQNLETHGYKNWYDFCTNEWGTKWDVEPYDNIPVTINEKGALVFGFDSAWAPPVGVYEALVNQGFEVRAYYYEPGMAFAGLWDNGDDDFYELGGMSSTMVAETIPKELDDEFGISECIAEYEEEEDEED